MSENSEDVAASGETNKVGPDYFGLYASEVAELLSQDEGLLPISHQVSQLAENLHEVGRGKGTSKNSCRTKENNGISSSAPLYSNGIGALLSEFKKERLKSLLRHSVFTLTKGVDEMIDPILSVCRLRSCLRCKESLLNNGTACRADQTKLSHKKRKVSPSCSDLKSEHMHLAKPGKELSNDVMKKCTQCHATSTPQWRATPDGKCLCNACGLRYFKDVKNGSLVNSDIKADKERVEIDDDLRLLLENDSTKVEELMKKHSGELSATLLHMEQKLEELLNAVMTSCRPMTHLEKQQLRMSIQKLPPKNLDRVVEIIRQNRPSEKYSSDEVRVDLEEQDNVTLWRLYYYVKAIYQ
ncbi:hypothetical protein BUALT_Bualt04G0166400 [Buddleja alternifolia]|uniref:GATA-type domain-containing protein n=1 Tax=Buddleja alternifolia TaxID=168488 RepID=A0AAV6XWC2_9LAMI|nr:hypothetical protein BUALT_Bualt04G0166400 [Buddleja alternifolia]